MSRLVTILCFVLLVLFIALIELTHAKYVYGDARCAFVQCVLMVDDGGGR